MLGTIREKTQGIFAVIIVGLLIIPFALWGINSYFESDRNPTVATVNGVDIKKDEYESTYQAQVNRLRGRVDPKFLASGIVREQVLSSMVNEVVYNGHAKDAGYVFSNAQLNAMIQSQPEFQNGGKFDPARFTAVLRANGMDEATYKREMRYIKVQDQMLSGLKFSAIVTRSEVDHILALQEQQRKFSYLVLQPSYLKAKVKVSDAEIKEYYDANKLRFQTADEVRIDYVVLSLDSLLAKQTVSEKELRDYYERNINQYTTLAERRASHILIELPSDADAQEEQEAKAKIATIQAQLKAGKSFAELAKQYSQDPLTARKGGDLGKIKPGSLPSRDLESALVKLKQGEVSPPVRSQYGLHLLQLTSLIPSKTRSFASMRKELERSLKVRRSEAAFDDLRERFETLVYEHPESLQPAATDTGLKIQTSDWLTHAGGKGLLANPDVIKAAFSTQVRQTKQNSDVIETGRNQLVAVHIRDDRPATDKPLSQVSGEIRAILMQNKAQQAARDVGEDLLRQARAGKSLASLATGEKGASLKGPVWVKRAELESGKVTVDKSVAHAAFAADIKDGKPAYGGLEISGGAYAIYQLSEIKPGDAGTASPKEREAVEQLLTDRRGSGYYRDTLASLRQQAEVDIHADRIKTAQ